MSHIPKYHGTSKQVALVLRQGKVNPKVGGGELGQGFYLGEHLWVAKSWAYNRYGNSSGVLKVEVPDEGFYALSIELLSRTEAIAKRKQIKNNNATRTYIHGVDVLWSPIVGTTRINADQYKYESQDAADLLNSTSCNRSIV